MKSKYVTTHFKRCWWKKSTAAGHQLRKAAVAEAASSISPKKTIIMLNTA